MDVSSAQQVAVRIESGEKKTGSSTVNVKAKQRDMLVKLESETLGVKLVGTT